MKKQTIMDDYKHSIRICEGVFEVSAITLVYYLAWKLFYRDALPQTYDGLGEYILAGVYAALTLIIFKLSDCFKYGHLKRGDLIVSQGISAFIIDFISYFQLCLVANKMLNPFPMLLVLVIDVCVCAGCCWLFTFFYHKLYVPHDMLLIYGNESALDLKFKMDKRADRYTITEVISVESGTENLIDVINRHDAVIINDVAGIKRNDILKYCYEHSVRTYLVPKISDIIMEGADDINLFDTPLKLVKGRGLSLPNRIMKRVMDIVLCLIAMIPGAPLMLVIALAIKLEDHGPVFYRQKRVTRDGKTFDILKFRSMVVDAEKGGYDLTMRANGKDPRITKVGTIIRATRVDELPQILNILKGDMSIVGPRPERVENVEAYAKDIPEWHLREKVKGGLTGYAQIYGRYNTSPMDKTKLDVMYIENYSLFLDIKLILMTVRIMFTPESTEGFDAVEELKEKREKLIRELERDTTHAGV